MHADVHVHVCEQRLIFHIVVSAGLFWKHCLSYDLCNAGLQKEKMFCEQALKLQFMMQSMHVQDR